MRSLVNHHTVLPLVLLGIQRKAKVLGALLGSLRVTLLPRPKQVNLVIDVSLIMLILLRPECRQNNHKQTHLVTQGLLIAQPLEQIFRRGGPEP